MKPLSPHDPFDDLIAAALHGELTPEERTQFEVRLSNDPAAQAAYQEAQAMHDLLEKTHASAQPDPAFEQRMVSGVRRKIETEKHRETAWESVVALWAGFKGFFTRKRKPLGPIWQYAIVLLIILPILAGVALGPITNGIKQAKGSAEMQEARQLAMAKADNQEQIDDLKALMPAQAKVEAMPAIPGAPATPPPLVVTTTPTTTQVTTVFNRQPTASSAFNVPAPDLTMKDNSVDATAAAPQATERLAKIADAEKAIGLTPQGKGAIEQSADQPPLARAEPPLPAAPTGATSVAAASDDFDVNAVKTQMQAKEESALAVKLPISKSVDASGTPSTPAPAAPPPAIDTRKLIRNAQLDLEVKSFQAAMDQITALTKTAGGYVDTSNSQKGGNGKLQGTVVVKVLPQNLDDFLLKLRDLGQVNNQSVSTDDVTKDYFDTQARLVNSQKMETQLQDLLKRENGKVSDLLAVERELGRVRGDIEQMQGQLKLYDFEVQYATITIQMREKDLNQAAAYLLKEQDDFSLFAADVENTFQKAKQAAADYKAQILVANLVHNSATDVAAEMTVMVAPEQVEAFLTQIRSLGRVANFTRQTQRIAKDGGSSDQPADLTLTDRDKVQVHLAIRSDNELRKEVLKEQDDFSLYATDVEDAFQKARQAADEFKAQVLVANLVHNSGSDVSGEMKVMVPPDQIDPFLAQVRSLGRIANFTRQTQRVISGGNEPNDAADQTPVEKDKVEVHLAIRSDDETRKQVALTMVAKAVDDALDQAKTAALANAGIEILSSSLNKTPQGASTAQLTVRVPGKDYTALIAAFNALGRTASLSIQRNDDSGPGANGDDAPVIVALSLTDDDTPLQETQISILATDVDNKAQQIKKDAAANGVEVKASSFERQPDGTELAQMTFRLPMAKYAAFVENLNQLGKVESLTVHRDDRPDQTRADDTAPAEISLQMHNQGNIVTDDNGLWATLRQTFGDGAGALFGSVRVIGVAIAFLTPWVFTLGLMAWVGRRIYVWRKR